MRAGKLWLFSRRKTCFERMKMNWVKVNNTIWELAKLSTCYCIHLLIYSFPGKVILPLINFKSDQIFARSRIMGIILVALLFSSLTIGVSSPRVSWIDSIFARLLFALWGAWEERRKRIVIIRFSLNSAWAVLRRKRKLRSQSCKNDRQSQIIATTVFVTLLKHFVLKWQDLVFESINHSSYSLPTSMTTL